MKKIISVVLAVACLCLLISCGATRGFQKAIEDTNPTKISVTTTVTSPTGLILNGQYDATYAEDGSATVKYDYEIAKGLSETEANNGPLKERKSGTVTLNADGTFTDNGAVTGSAAEAVVSEIEIDLGNIESEVTESEDGNTISATVAAANTEAVFGVAYDHDVTITLTKGEDVIETITISYVDLSGNTVVVTCMYD